MNISQSENAQGLITQSPSAILTCKNVQNNHGPSNLPCTPNKSDEAGKCRKHRGHALKSNGVAANTTPILGKGEPKGLEVTDIQFMQWHVPSQATLPVVRVIIAHSFEGRVWSPKKVLRDFPCGGEPCELLGRRCDKEKSEKELKYPFGKRTAKMSAKIEGF